ncbi:S-methyl-5-thioribose-1-phosphate isomerase [Purpureocillium takamizusanense]|uniref:Methylthioribose-1-phosphate isomerase n=1 Tax=Purpureocillium takamizusanense TaxID=2060973 RepID=A0A9Q8QDW6_9HYPO|nr:S-methyl-5-thioribose-1-phosphate isomerase [Purpureocillium takamizusanense]UNI17116.1 S-methyl-5-thioribose-1-phosphate isomerase [Purpureocillium takamizusanense]
MSLQAVRYSRGKLEVLDQLRLPHEFHYDAVTTRKDAFDSIASMRVRGAPAIAIVASLGLAVELHNAGPGVPGAASAADAVAHIDDALDYLKTSRPTAVDLSNAIDRLKTCTREAAAASSSSSPDDIVRAFVDEAEAIFERDLQTNLAIGEHGAEWLRAQGSAAAAGGSSNDKTMSVLTHCNTGSLATSGHGTALGIIRTLRDKKLLRHAFCTETRPYNQGSRLTAFELVYEGIPATLITDSMAAALFRTRGAEANLAAVIVGADRVVRNGDTANKIGTYQLAVLARHHGVRFVVAAPTTSIDLATRTGDGIKIEERKPEELTQVTGAVIRDDGTVDEAAPKVRVATADQRIGVWNPAFDVTPAEYIDAVVTEKGVVERGADGVFDFSHIMPERWAAVVGKEEEEQRANRARLGAKFGTAVRADTGAPGTL